MDTNPMSSTSDQPNSSSSPTTVTTTTSSSSSLSLSSNSSIFKLLNDKNFLRGLFSNLNLSSRRLRFPRSSSSNHNKPTKLSNPVVSSLHSFKSRNGTVHPNLTRLTEQPEPDYESGTPPHLIRIATFNASLFSMAPAVPPPDTPNQPDVINSFSGPLLDRLNHPKSILKKKSPSLHHSPTTTTTEKTLNRPRVSINLPDNEISLGRHNRRHQPTFYNEADRMSPTAMSSPGSSGSSSDNGCGGCSFNSGRSDRTVADVLRELDLDILALQEIKAEEERGMKPLSDLASYLGMKHYVFAESWAPQFGNAVLSKWPIKRWRVQKIVDDSDFRNVLKTTIDIPRIGELNLYCTHLDHLNESWRMKQIQSIINSNNNNTISTLPHILVGGLNTLDRNDYSQQRWTDIVQYYEEIGKPTPKSQVMKYLKKTHNYTDAKDFAGEFESVVVAVKGQSVQGTCKYGTRVDYVLASPGCPYKFVSGSYSVCSSKGTSDHHIVKVDLERVERIQDIAKKKRQNNNNNNNNGRR